MSATRSLLACALLAACTPAADSADDAFEDDRVGIPDDPEAPDYVRDLTGTVHDPRHWSGAPDEDTDAGDDTDVGEPLDEPNGVVVVDEVMVRVADQASLDRICVRYGTTVTAPLSDRRLAAIRVPRTLHRTELLDALADDEDVENVAPVGLITGASTPAEAQWHLEAAGVDSAPQRKVSNVVVAVLDTGVAYVDHVDEHGQEYQRAPSLANSTIRCPWDFVGDDAIPVDDHGHGTHIASLIASDGAVSGVAPGASLMPLKVLDADKRGTELDLIAALDHAVQCDADVINMSLAFAPGYVPSPELRAALRDAHDAGAVLVGAAGNDHVHALSWPAASPHVIAVAATDSQEARARYSNDSPAIDLSAPGGDLRFDRNGDGYPDGILAETITPGDPSRTGYAFMEGTSQAAALVSGAAARLVALDPEAEPAAIRANLLMETQGGWERTMGVGSGILHAADAEDGGHLAPDDIHVAMLPFLRDHGNGTISPSVHVVALDHRGEPVDDVHVYGTFSGSSSAYFRCRTGQWGAAGTCSISTARLARDPSEDALVWRVTVDSVKNKDGFELPPSSAVFASDALDVLTHAVRSDDRTKGAVLLFKQPAGRDDALGRTLAEAYLMSDLGTGFDATPVAILATRTAVAPYLDTEPVSLDLDGTGLLSSPMGFQRASLGILRPPTLDELALDGTGLLSSPMIGFRTDVLVMGASGPIPYGASHLFVPGVAPSVDVEQSRFDDETVYLGHGAIETTRIVDDTALAELLDNGGWNRDGYDGARLMMGSGTATTTVMGSSTTRPPVMWSE